MKDLNKSTNFILTVDELSNLAVYYLNKLYQLKNEDKETSDNEVSLKSYYKSRIKEIRSIVGTEQYSNISNNALNQAIFDFKGVLASFLASCKNCGGKRTFDDDNNKDGLCNNCHYFFKKGLNYKIKSN